MYKYIKCTESYNIDNIKVVNQLQQCSKYIIHTRLYICIRGELTYTYIEHILIAMKCFAES